MPVNIDAVRAAITAIEDISRLTHTFEHEGMQVVLRRVRAPEEHEVSRWALGFSDKIGQREFLERIKLGLLSYAIIRLGDLDLSEDTVNTGDTLSNGVAVSSPKHEVLREIMMLHWAVPTFEAMFVEYAKFIQATSKKLPKVEGETVDEQIDALQERIKSLEQLKEQTTKTPEEVIAGVVERGQKNRDPLESVLAPKAPDVPQTPPSEAFQEESEEPRIPRRYPQERRPIYPEEVRDPNGSAWDPHKGDSFMDASDPDQALRTENARQLAFLQKQQQMRPQSPSRGVPQVLANAARASEEFYRTDTEVLDNRAGSSVPPLQVQGEPQGQGSINPRFRKGRG